MHNDLIFKIALSMIPGVGGVLARNLMAYTGSAKNVFTESSRALQKVPGIGETLARSIGKKELFEKAEAELKFIEKYKINALFYTDPAYPRRLTSCPDAPVILYAKGKMTLDEQRVVSIIGTRHATPYGRSVCRELIHSFAERNYPVVVVSGLAYGIDIHAHKTALKYEVPTIGVLGHGLDKIYPAQHTDVARKMLLMGGLVTDFSSGTKIDPSNFIRRNRIIAGLADATIIIESADKGGALITADIASSYNRDVFAFPGRANEPYSRGCNRLIMTNSATLIQNIDDLEYFMGWDSTGKAKLPQPDLFTNLSAEEMQIVELLKNHESLYIDQISAELNISTSKTSGLLLNLEFKNLLETLPGKMYRLK